MTHFSKFLKVSLIATTLTTSLCATYPLFNRPIPLAGLIDLPNQDDSAKAVSYDKLTCSEENRKNIKDIIVTLGSHSGAAEIALLAHYQRLNSYEKELRKVHPLKFIEIAVKDSEMRLWLHSIMNGFFTRKGFLGDENSNGLAQRLSLKAKMGMIEPYRKDFAKAVGINPEYIRPFIEAQDWEGLMTFVIENAADSKLN